ncbi:helix-turn-helix domain-containing protein [Novosphingobium sp. FKTRR1]|uniref:helix-turn-helix domain-containing protein n=1 Tax=Novosphingobium sp. FKTRR1 TaxID=2879118 RepID=UPI001CEFF56E|nr:helix-turn-helix domain-containing protein [Novosphingobium sp. FKTRR1]
MNQPATIPSYALYGEHALPEAAGFAHIETIAARSALHDWEIRPHRHGGFVQVLLVREGQARISFDGTDSDRQGPCAVIVPAGTVHGFRFQQGTAGWVLTVSADFATRSDGLGDPLGPILARGEVNPLDEVAARRVGWLADELLVLQQEWRGRDPLALSLAEALVRTVARASEPAPAAGGADARLERFRQLVEIHFREHRDLDFYAEALGLTRRTLSRLIARRLGCSPSELLHRRLATEARRLLRYTGASAAQVAAELGFDDPSYFSRFYLRMTGKRPVDERG